MYPESWRDGGIWPRSEQLEDSMVAEIRDRLHYGPVSFNEAEDLARVFGIHPLTVINIAIGRSYLRPKACPEGHPLRVALNAELASKQRLRYQAQKHRKAVGDAQDWKCRYCGKDIFGRGQSALDHIVPVASGGTSDFDNLQMLCRRCNIRKSAKKPGSELDAYMNRKVDQDRIVEKVNGVLTEIVNSFIWPDSSQAPCPWCATKTEVIHEQEEVHDSNVFRCTGCRRMFRSGNLYEMSDLFSNLNYAIFGRMYLPVVEDEIEMIQSLMSGDLDRTRSLVREKAGILQEVRKRRHTHARGDCWCEYDGDAFRVVHAYHQTNPLRLAETPD